MNRLVDATVSIATLAMVNSFRNSFRRTAVRLLARRAFRLALLLALPWFSEAAPRPNIVVILVDDMGYSDIGCYGGEIHTPNLDKLAQGGVRFTQFHNTARCFPTRAALLTGLYPHQAGIGHMTEERQDPAGHLLPGYSGRLNDHCLTIAEGL